MNPSYVVFLAALAGGIITALVNAAASHLKSSTDYRLGLMDRSSKVYTQVIDTLTSENRHLLQRAERAESEATVWKLRAERAEEHLAELGGHPLGGAI